MPYTTHIICIPTVAKQTKPINSYSLQVEVQPVAPTHPKENKTLHILEAIYHAKCLERIIFQLSLMDTTPLVALVFHSVSVLPGSGSNGSCLPDFGICPLFFDGTTPSNLRPPCNDAVSS